MGQNPQQNIGRCENSYDSQEGQPFEVCQHVSEYPFVSSLVTWWVETILINTNLPQYAASHPIHQHGGWYWVVGEGQFEPDVNGNPTVTRSSIEAQYESGQLQVNDENHAWHGGVFDIFALPKDVIQVPNNGYVIIRTPLDNPGTWIFHCHIDFHLSIGMGKVLQIGEFGDWNTVPVAASVNEQCLEKPTSPRGEGAYINWFLYMIPAERCIVKGQDIIFTFESDHNVHEITEAQYDNCDVNYPNPEIGQKIFSTTNFEKGYHYFACGLGYENGVGFHCANGVKARILVVDDVQECHFSHH